jgi:glucan phosphorylase
MVRFILSFFGALIVGLLLGLYLGWVQFPVKYTDSSADRLAQRFKDDYTVMIANAYVEDSDLTGALERMRVLGVENVPAYIQETTERYITNSSDVNDIRALVALAGGLGRLTPIMEPYQRLTVPGQN